MKTSQVLYRKYRSSSFAEVVGQDHVVQTLTAALANGRVAHAYLFTGPRGTGKTSVARLLARAVNCTGQIKPCGACALCQVALNTTLDVIEIDAASNRSIDSIRELRDKVALAPSTGQYKIYIIDEVHMLTTEAFNALLKTLEEPPAHAIFILATTEAHKVPETIISRTQRLNFRPIALDDLTKHLAHIATSENISIEADALEMIARAARGGFRDAIGMLDQLSAAGNRAVTVTTVRDILGYASQSELVALAETIAAGNAAGALTTVATLTATGAAPTQTVLGLIELWRSIMRAGAGATPAANVPASLAGVAPIRAAEIIDKLIEVSRSSWPELALEAALVQLTSTITPAPAKAPRQTVKSKDTVTEAPVVHHDDEPTTAEDAPPTADLWPKVIVLVKSKNNSLGALLQMYQTEFSIDAIIVKARFNFHRDLFMKPVNRTLIEAAACKVYGRPIKVSSRTEDDGAPASRRKAPKPDPASELVTSALEILGGEVVE